MVKKVSGPTWETLLAQKDGSVGHFCFRSAGDNCAPMNGKKNRRKIISRK